jgi:hypothetical protein
MSKDLEGFKKTVETCTEYSLYFIIHELTYFDWRMNHDIADGRIETSKIKSIDEDLVKIRKLVEYAREQTKRFGVKETTIDGERYYNEKIKGNGLLEKLTDKRDYPKDKQYSSDEYINWYEKWDKWKDNLTDKEWKKFNKSLKDNEFDITWELLPEWYEGDISSV